MNRFRLRSLQGFLPKFYLQTYFLQQTDFVQDFVVPHGKIQLVAGIGNTSFKAKVHFKNLTILSQM